MLHYIDYSKSTIKNINDAKQNFKLVNLEKFIDFVEVKLNKSIELFDKVNDETMDQGDGKESSDYKSPEHIEAINFLQSIFIWFSYYMLKSFQPVNNQIIRIIPQVYKFYLLFYLVKKKKCFNFFFLIFSLAM